MLKRTSKHHQPTHLAAAVAVGLVVGLVPKANLLAVGLYAALLWLPIHTWLALGVSLVVACGAGYLDPLSHGLGSWLLQQPMLQPLWYFLDNAAVLPWLGLHNTVVLGDLVGGVMLAGPAYVLSLRLFDRLRWQAVARPQAELEETIVPARRPAEPASVPPPKFARDRQPMSIPAAQAASHATEEEEFEPAREVAAIINSWHMGHVAHKHSQSHAARVTSVPIARATAGQSSSPDSSSASGGGSTNQDNSRAGKPTARDILPPRSFDPPQRPQRLERSEIVDSLDLAHSAGEVLAWVDEMLEDCLSEDSARLAVHDIHSSSTVPPASAHDLPSVPPAEHDVGEERWLMETTIEVVRWGDEIPPDIQPTIAPSPCEPTKSAADDTPSQQASMSSAAQPLPNSWAQSRPTGNVPSCAIDDDGACRSDGPSCRMSIVPFVQPGSQPRRSAPVEPEMHASDTSEPQRGECLGYLLGHLRQEREGRSS